METKCRPILKELEDEVIASGRFEPKVVYGYFGAQEEGNDVIVYNLAQGSKEGDPVPTEALRFTFPRRKEGRHLSIPDFFVSKASGKMDVLGLTCVTIGAKASHETQKLFDDGEYPKYLSLHGLSVETAEALAELAHKRVREELLASPEMIRRTSATSSIRGTADHASHSAIRLAQKLRTRPSCSRCSIPTRRSECT